MKKKQKELGVDKQGIQLTMRQKDFWAYAVGVTGIAVITNLIGQFSFFYTDKVGMTAALAGSALMIAKIADAFTDLVMGYIVDHTKSKYGKARPWMLWMAPLVLISVILLLCMPADMSQKGKFIYAIITNIFATAVVTTAISVPYGCLITYRTQSQVERTQMNVKRAIINYLMGMFFAIGFIPLTVVLGGTQKSWILVSVIVAVVSCSCMIITFLHVKEENAVVEEKKENKKGDSNFLKDIGSLFQNKYWVLMALAQLIANICLSLNAATNIYYAKWIFGSESIVAVMGIIGFIPTLLGFFFVSPLVKKFGAVNVVKCGFILGIIGSIGKALFPRSFIGVCLFGSMTAVSTMPFMMVAMVLIANVADFQEWKSGKTMVGLVNSAGSFGAKVGAGVGAGMIGWVLALGKYDALAATQSASAINSIMAISIWIPGIMILALFLIMCAYDIDKKYPNFRTELMERRNKK